MVYSILLCLEVSRTSEIKIYEIMLKSIAVYGYETWYMTENIQGKEDSDEDVWTSN
jgi:hypothetical protein